MQTLSRKEQIILVSFTWAVNALVLSDHTASSYGFLSRIPVQTSMHVSNSRRRNVTRAMYTGSNWSILDFSPVEEIFKASYICKKSKLKTLFYWKVFYDTTQNIHSTCRAPISANFGAFFIFLRHRCQLISSHRNLWYTLWKFQNSNQIITNRISIFKKCIQNCLQTFFIVNRTITPFLNGNQRWLDERGNFFGFFFFLRSLNLENSL